MIESDLGVDGTTFKSILLNRCRQEHLQRLQLIKEMPERAAGFAIFMAELYSHLMARDTNGHSKPIIALGTALVELLTDLINTPTKENVKCVTQVLKMTGAKLEEDKSTSGNDSYKEKFDSLLAHIKQLQQGNTITCQTSMILLKKVVDLQADNWGIVQSTESSPKSNPAPNNPYYDGAVLYGPDGKELSPEEAQFLTENLTEESDEDGWAVGTEDMDKDLLQDFEKFLKFSNQQI